MASSSAAGHSAQSFKIGHFSSRVTASLFATGVFDAEAPLATGDSGGASGVL